MASPGNGGLSETDARKKLHEEIEERHRVRDLNENGQLDPAQIVAEFDGKGRFIVNVSDRIDACNLLDAKSKDGSPGCIAVVVYDGRNTVGLLGRLFWLALTAWDWHKVNNRAAQKRNIVTAGLDKMAGMLKRA